MTAAGGRRRCRSRAARSGRRVSREYRVGPLLEDVSPLGDLSAASRRQEADGRPPGFSAVTACDGRPTIVTPQLRREPPRSTAIHNPVTSAAVTSIAESCVTAVGGRPVSRTACAAGNIPRHPRIRRIEIVARGGVHERPGSSTRQRASPRNVGKGWMTWAE